MTLSFIRIFGKLVYMTVIRSDTTYVVNSLSQHMAHPTKGHLFATHMVLIYIKNSPGHGLFFSGYITLEIKAFSYSKWASCPFTQRLTIGFTIYIGESLVS